MRMGGIQIVAFYFRQALCRLNRVEILIHAIESFPVEITTSLRTSQHLLRPFRAS